MYLLYIINGHQVANHLFLCTHFPSRSPSDDLQADAEFIRWRFRPNFRCEWMPDDHRFSSTHPCVHPFGARIHGPEVIPIK